MQGLWKQDTLVRGGASAAVKPPLSRSVYPLATDGGFIWVRVHWFAQTNKKREKGKRDQHGVYYNKIETFYYLAVIYLPETTVDEWQNQRYFTIIQSISPQEISAASIPEQ